MKICFYDRGIKLNEVIIYPNGIYTYNGVYYLFKSWSINLDIHDLVKEWFKKAYGL